MRGIDNILAPILQFYNDNFGSAIRYRLRISTEPPNLTPNTPATLSQLNDLARGPCPRSNTPAAGENTSPESGAAY